VLETHFKRNSVITKLVQLIANGMHMDNGVSVLRHVEEVDNHEVELSKLMQQLEDNHVKDQEPNLVVAALSHVLETVLGMNLDIGDFAAFHVGVVYNLEQEE